MFTLLLVAFLTLGYDNVCYASKWCYPYYGLLFYLEMDFFWAPIILVFLGIVWFLDNRIFSSWIRVSVPWVTVSLIISVLTPDAGAGFISTPIKFYVILGLYALYILISFFIILIQSIRIYWLKK